MDYKLEVKEEARGKILAGFFYYTKEVNLDLAQRFIAETEQVLEYIHKNPENFQIKYKNFREAVFKIFPYVLIYEIIEEIVVVYTLFLTSHDPKRKP